MTPRYGMGLVVLVVIVVVGSDGVRTGIVKSGVIDEATQIAHDSATLYHDTSNVDTTFAAAQKEAAAKGATISAADFSVTSGGTVSLTLVKPNHTLVLGRLDSSLQTFSAQSSSTWAP